MAEGAPRLVLVDEVHHHQRSANVRFTAYDLRTRRRTGQHERPAVVHETRCGVADGALVCLLERRHRVDADHAHLTPHEGPLPQGWSVSAGCGYRHEAAGWRIEGEQVLRPGQVGGSELAPGERPPLVVATSWFLTDSATGQAILIDGVPIVGTPERLIGLDATGAARWQREIDCQAATQLDGQLILATPRPGRIVVLDGRTGTIAEVLLAK